MNNLATHSCIVAPHLKDELANGSDNKYGRMFPDLPSPEANEEEILLLGRSGSFMDVDAAPDVGVP